MTTIWKGFLALLAQATDSELTKMVEFLKTENRMLRAKLPRRVDVTAAERGLLVKLGNSLGASKLKERISIVSPRTFARWLKADGEGPPVEKSSSKGGRPKTPIDVRVLVLRMAKENGWGFGRILGEVCGLDMSILKNPTSATRSVVKNVILGTARATRPRTA